MTVTRASSKKLLRNLLAKSGFSADGNYFRRQTGDALQALYLQPSVGSHCYFPDMLITYPQLGPGRKNFQSDCHLSARLSEFYHPDGDPRETPLQEWTIHYDSPDTSDADLEKQLTQAIPKLLWWLDEYPTYSIAQEKMKLWSHAGPVSRHRLFQDLCMNVPIPE